MIHSNQKVADILKHHPQTYHVFRRHGCPDMHRVHHSRWQPETDSNYSALFSFWDRMARTFRLNPKPDTIRLGLDEFDSEDDQTVSGMMKMPVRKDRRVNKN